MAKINCSRCKKEIEIPQKTGAAGYGIHGKTGKRICYECCADLDRAHMINHGKIDLYFSRDKSGGYAVTNWCGSLRFKPIRVSKGRHNIARTRHDVWFTGPDGKQWHGVQYGEWTQICHCKSTNK